MTESIKLPEEGFVRLPTVLQVLPMGESSWYKGIREGRYPKPVSLGGRVVAWNVKDIRQLINQIAGNVKQG